MAVFLECMVRGGRAFVDSGDIAAVIVQGDDFEGVRSPDSPIRFLLSGCGDTIDVYGMSIRELFDGDEIRSPWLNPEKFQRLSCKGGRHVFLHARHIVGITMSGVDDKALTTEKSPLGILVRGAKEKIDAWGMSACDFMFWMLSDAKREFTVRYLPQTLAAA